MARLPDPGGDQGTWGDILNDFLKVEHNEDGTLKRAGEIASKYVKPAAGIPESDLSSAVQTKLNRAAVILDGSIDAAKLADGAVTDAKVASINQSKVSGLVTSLRTKLNASVLGQPDGVATLDADGKLPVAQLPEGVGSSSGFTVISKASNYTARSYEFVVCDATDGMVIITLPVPASGALVRVKKVDATVNAVVVQASAGVQIDDGASASINQQWQSNDFLSDGTKWYFV